MARQMIEMAIMNGIGCGGKNHFVVGEGGMTKGGDILYSWW